MPSDVTTLLQRHRDGDAEALDGLLHLVYGELRGVARNAFRNCGRDGHTLQPTALVNEAWLKLGGSLDNVQHRAHFFALAARIMRQVLSDHARRRLRQKRGSGRQPLLIDESTDGSYEPDDLVALDESLSRLATLNERHARVVELRIFGALTVAETADELGVSRRTVEADWALARAWLMRELGA